MLGKSSEGSSQSRSFSWKPMITIEDKGSLGKRRSGKSGKESGILERNRHCVNWLTQPCYWWKFSWKENQGAVLDLAFLSRFQKFNFYLVFLRLGSISLAPFDHAASLWQRLWLKALFWEVSLCAAQFICFGRVILKLGPVCLVQPCRQQCVVAWGMLQTMKLEKWVYPFQLKYPPSPVWVGILLLTSCWSRFLVQQHMLLGICLLVGSELITLKDFPSEAVWCEQGHGYTLTA